MSKASEYAKMRQAEQPELFLNTPWYLNGPGVLWGKAVVTDKGDLMFDGEDGTIMTIHAMNVPRLIRWLKDTFEEHNETKETQ